MPTSTSNAATDSQDASQDFDAVTMQSMMEQHKRNVKTRRRDREDRVRLAHKQRFKELNGKIEQVANAHEKQLKAIQLLQVQRLSALMQRKMSLEQGIQKSLDGMAQAFDTAAQHLGAGIRGRIDDLHTLE